MKTKLLLMIIIIITNSLLAQWEYVNPPVFDKAAIDIETYNNKLYLLTGNGDLFEFNDTDNSWINLTNGFINSGGFGEFNRSVQFADDNIFVSTSSGMFVSPDNGASWQQDTTGFNVGSNALKALFLFTDGIKIFTSLEYPQSGFFVKDAVPGEWTRIDDSVLSYLGNSIAGMCKINDTYYAVTKTSGFFESTDGINWTSKETNGLVNSIPFHEFSNRMMAVNSDILIAADDGLYKSIDLGSNWARIDNGFAIYDQLSKVTIGAIHYDGSSLYASVSSDDSAYVSTDFGATWSDISNGLEYNIRSMTTYKNVLWGVQAQNKIATFTSTTSAEENISSPSKFKLSQNYPNPFNPTTRISYSLPIEGLVKLIVYNSLGQEIVTLVNQNMSSGEHQVVFNASNLPSGIYFYKINVANEFIESKKMLLLK